MKEQWIRDLRKRIHKEKIIVFKGRLRTTGPFRLGQHLPQRPFRTAISAWVWLGMAQRRGSARVMGKPATPTNA